MLDKFGVAEEKKTLKSNVKKLALEPNVKKPEKPSVSIEDLILETVKLKETKEQRTLEKLKNNGETIIENYVNEPLKIRKLVKRAVNGDFIAQHKLYLEYFEGKSVKKDIDLAKYWCKLSAECGYDLGKLNYGLYCIHYEDNTESDEYIYELFLDCYSLIDSTYMLGFHVFLRVWNYTKF